MAAVSGLMRRPLEQVHSGTRACARFLPTLRLLSASSLSPPGLRAAEETLPPDDAGGAAGKWRGRPPGQGGGRPSPGGGRGRACAMGRGTAAGPGVYGFRRPAWDSSCSFWDPAPDTPAYHPRQAHWESVGRSDYTRHDASSLTLLLNLYCTKIHKTNVTILKCIFSGTKSNYYVVRPSPPSVFRTLSPSQSETLPLKQGTSHIPQLLVTSIALSVPVNLSILGTSCKCNPTLFS